MTDEKKDKTTEAVAPTEATTPAPEGAEAPVELTVADLNNYLLCGRRSVLGCIEAGLCEFLRQLGNTQVEVFLERSTKFANLFTFLNSDPIRQIRKRKMHCKGSSHRKLTCLLLVAAAAFSGCALIAISQSARPRSTSPTDTSSPRHERWNP